MNTQSHVTLPDGRRLGYGEYGSPDGRGLFLFHGQPGNRLFYPPGDAAERLNVRVIVPDRPGYGLSDLQLGRRLLDWPADIAYLADALGMKRFALAGFSAGGAYAAACALRLPERVTRTGLISAMPPLAGGAWERLPQVKQTPTLRINSFLARRARPLLEWSFNLYWQISRRNPHQFLAMAARQSAPADRAVIEDAQVANMLLATWEENLRVDSRGYVYDAQLLFGPWGFDPRELPKGIYLWHGQADGNAPLAWGQALAEAIPACRAAFYPDEGHFCLFNHWEEILQTLTGRESDGRAPRPAGPAVQWLAIGRGRLGLSPRPGSKTFQRLHEAGCTRLVTLLSAREGAPGVGRAAADHHMAWSWLPLHDGTPPTGEIAERFVHGLLQLREQIRAGESAVLHCAAGIHRTGMAAYTLLRLTGLDEEQALAGIAEMRTFTREGIQGKHIAFGNQVAQCQAEWEQSAAQALPVPFPAAYWVIPGKLLAGPYPGSPQPSDAEHKLRALAACGVQRVINLMEEQEVDHQSRPFVPYQEQLTAFGAESGQTMEFARYPIHDLWVPTPELMVLILDDIDRSIAAGKGVYVHCWGGIGRTGTVIGCYLARHGIAQGEIALRALAELRHRVLPWRDSPETDAQRALVSSWSLGR